MAADAQPGAYRVLARKYRPKGFEDLIGQEAMVRTLTNAFAADRIHQAYVFTGVRGVGKTTTARIIARALNYETEDGSVTKPTIDMPAFGKHCEAIIESRHVDVIEMDAASNTSVNDVREIIEAVRYRPAYARYKVYIIDEVHMLSGSAFNALLKTLEEPPEHVKFLFATTEIKKVPVTVLSRCQRFDLKRIPTGLMIDHLKGICGKEQVAIEDEALAMIARAGEGSVRDSLSLLDQAIAHGAGRIEAGQIRDMLGLADRGRVIDLFALLMKGDIAASLAELAAQYDAGADPASVVTDLAEYVHTVTRLKLAPSASDDATLTEDEKRRGQDFARDLSIRTLTRAWQILTKGLSEVQLAPRPIVAAEMLMVRLAYAADLPTPDEALRMLKDGADAGPAAPAGSVPRGGGGGGAAAQAIARPVLASASPVRQPQSAPVADAAPRIRIDSLPQLVALATERRDILTATAVRSDIRLVRLEDGVLEFGLARNADPAIVQRLQGKLMEWTGRRWMVSLSNEPGDPTLAEIEDAKRAEETAQLHRHPVVQAVLEKWPGAKVLPPPRKAQPPASFADLAAQPVVNEDGDVVVGEGDFTEDDL
ncbi:MAG: DNA polymerase III subunit gamma/tau [Beijerinckiaceae bacterium]